MPVTSEITSDYSGSITPTTSGEESEEEEDSSPKKLTESSSLLWSGVGAKRIAFIMFRPESLISRDKKLKAIGEKYHLAYKMVKTESKLVRSVLSAYGFHEVHPNSPDFNLMWTGAHLKPFSLRSLQDFQKVNHFPRSYEITRKDRLFKNIDRMAHTKGPKHFDFMPKSYLMPSEYQDFCAAYVKDKGPWIVKPIASSRGRGIYLINNPNQVPLEDNIMVCKYIANPLLIDGFKFDIRVYIAVTSYDPLLIYLFEEGLTRFATVKYEKTNRHLKNQMMHLTNYSINKKSHDYVRCEDPEVEDYGNKWSMSAMLRYLKQEGIDTNSLMMKIEAVIIKAIIAAELPIATACKMFVPNRENCVELYGFDILVDENLKPWLLEGNLSPSLACDAPLDLKIKSCMVSDFFSLVGFPCVDPLTRRQKKDQTRRPYSAKGLSGVSSMQGTQSKRPISASGTKESSLAGLSNDEAKVLRMAKEQYQRRGSFIRIFPTPETWELYGSFLEYKSSLNLLLSQKLFPDRVKLKVSGAYSNAVARMRSIASGQMLEGRNRVMSERFMQYERKLLSLETLKHKRTKKNYKKNKKDTPVGIDSKSLPQGQLKKAKKSTNSISDVSEDGEDTEESESEEQADKGLSKSPKLHFSTSANAGSSKIAKLKKSDAQKPSSAANGGAGGDLNALIKSAYASSRNSATTRSVQNSFSVASSSKTSLNAKSGAKSAPKERTIEKKSQIQRIYTYKSTDKNNEAGDSKPSTIGHSKQNLALGTDGDKYSMSSESGENNDEQNGSKQKATMAKLATTSSKQSAVVNPNSRKFHKRTTDVLQALKAGGNLGKVQARQAFSAYLSRVQQRLLGESEVHSQENSESVSKQEEQMDLVLRFLKRAAGNLKQSFSVVVPSRRLCLPDRKRILAKQLGDFVHIYNKETDAMEHKQQIGFDRDPLDNWSESVKDNVKDSDFRQFVLSACEAELEEVLTTYTHKNKSASVFLGAGKPKPKEKRESPNSATTTVPLTSLLSQRKINSVDHLQNQALIPTGTAHQSEEQKETQETTSLYELNLHRRTATPFSSMRMRSPSPSIVTNLSSRTSAHHPSSAFLHLSPTMGSMQHASYTPSAKLIPPTSVTNAVITQPAPQKRPASASDFNQVTSSVSQTTSRPISAATGRSVINGSLQYQTAANEEAIAEALQKLAERQAARQYSATSQLQALTQHLSNLNLTNMAAARQQIAHTNIGPQRASSLTDLANNSNMIDQDLWEDSSSNIAGNKFANPATLQYNAGLMSGSPGQSQALAQQSKELLQQSKAKHQAMLVQAHNDVSVSEACLSSAGGGEASNMRKRPSSASMIYNTISSTRSLPIPRPPEKPKPVVRATPVIKKPLGNPKTTRNGSHSLVTGLTTNPSTLSKVSDFKFESYNGISSLNNSFDANCNAEIGARPSSAKRPWKP